MKNEIIEISDFGLQIVPEGLNDARDIYLHLGCDPEISRYTGWNPYNSLDATINKIKNDMETEEVVYSWVIKKNSSFIGTIGAYDYKPDDLSIEIGYSIARQFWGNGYAGAAAKAVAEYLEEESHIESIRAWSHKNNIASRKVLLHAGFKEITMNGEQIIYER